MTRFDRQVAYTACCSVCQWVASLSLGVRYPRVEWSLRALSQPSIQATITRLASARVSSEPVDQLFFQ